MFGIIAAITTVSQLIYSNQLINEGPVKPSIYDGALKMEFHDNGTTQGLYFRDSWDDLHKADEVTTQRVCFYGHQYRLGKIDITTTMCTIELVPK